MRLCSVKKRISSMPNFACFKSRLVFVVALAFMTMNAEAQQTIYKPNVGNSLEVIDRRPNEEDKQHTLSLWIGSCDYFVTRLGDKGMKITRIEKLTADLSDRLSTVNLDAPIYVEHYTLHLNAGVQMVNSAFNAAAGAFGGVIRGNPANISARCPREKMKGGWFSNSEVRNDNPPLIADIEIRYKDRTFRARSVFSPEKQFNENSKNDKYGAMKLSAFSPIAIEISNQLVADGK